MSSTKSLKKFTCGIHQSGNTSGKDEVAELYKSFGMTVFHDMLPRAKKAHELDDLLRKAQREVAKIQEEIEELSCPTLIIE